MCTKRSSRMLLVIPFMCLSLTVFGEMVEPHSNIASERSISRGLWDTDVYWLQRISEFFGGGGNQKNTNRRISQNSRRNDRSRKLLPEPMPLKLHYPDETSAPDVNSNLYHIKQGKFPNDRRRQHVRYSGLKRKQLPHIRRGNTKFIKRNRVKIPLKVRNHRKNEVSSSPNFLEELYTNFIGTDDESDQSQENDFLLSSNQQFNNNGHFDDHSSTPPFPHENNFLKTANIDRNIQNEKNRLDQALALSRPYHVVQNLNLPLFHSETPKFQRKTPDENYVHPGVRRSHVRSSDDYYFDPSPKEGNMRADAFQPIFRASPSLDEDLPESFMRPMHVASARALTFAKPAPPPEIMNFFEENQGVPVFVN